MDVKYIGWNNKGNHDKVWGAILLSDTGPLTSKYLIFWGRRGAKLQTKVTTYSHNGIMDLCRAKSNKGYKEIAKHEMSRVYSSFSEDIEKAAIWAKLKV